MPRNDDNGNKNFYIRGNVKGNVGDHGTYHDNSQSKRFKYRRSNKSDPVENDTPDTARSSASRRHRRRKAQRVGDVFVSYSRRDINYAALIVQKLEDRNVRVWWDQLNIPPGTNWQVMLQRGLKQARCMVLCLSPTALDSDYVRYEYRTFLNNRKRVFPVMIENVELPSELSRIQYIDFGDVDRMMPEIIRHLRR